MTDREMKQKGKKYEREIRRCGECAYIFADGIVLMCALLPDPDYVLPDSEACDGFVPGD